MRRARRGSVPIPADSRPGRICPGKETEPLLGAPFFAALPWRGLFVPLTQGNSFLSVPDGVLNGVLPPAGDFLCEQKVTKNSLRTYGSKNSLVLTWNDSPP